MIEHAKLVARVDPRRVDPRSLGPWRLLLATAYLADEHEVPARRTGRRVLQESRRLDGPRGDPSHAVSRFEPIPCTRCSGRRRPFTPPADPFVCQRCQAILRGAKNVVDPLRVPTPGQVACGRALRARLRSAGSPVAPRGSSG
jgi:hypothetical protein